MSKAIFYAEKKSGKMLIMDRLILFNTYIEKLPVGRYEVEIRKEAEDKTLQQLSYYFSCVVQPLADELGYSKVECDGVLCKQLLTENPGTKKEYVTSKSDLNRAQLAAFIDKAIMLAAQNGVVVAPPNRAWKDTR